MARSVEIPLMVVVSLTVGVLLERAVDHHLTPPSTPVILKAQERGRMYPSSEVEVAWWKLHVPAYIDIERSADIEAAKRK